MSLNQNGRENLHIWAPGEVGGRRASDLCIDRGDLAEEQRGLREGEQNHPGDGEERKCLKMKTRWKRVRRVG